MTQKKLLEAAKAEAALEETRRAEAKLGKLQSEVKKWKDLHAAAEREAEAAAQRMAVLVRDTPRRTLDWHPSPSPTGGKSLGIIGLTDWHVGETVDSQQVNGMNEFNLDICDQRIKAVAANAVMLVENARSLAKIDDLLVWLGGDMITGYIHEELRESCDLSDVEQVDWCEDRLAWILAHLHKELKPKSMLVVCNYGNHGRLTHKPRTGRTKRENSLEWLLYQRLQKTTRLPRTTWNVAAGSRALVHTYGTTLGFEHGDDFKYQGGVGGLTIPVKRSISRGAQWERADLTIFGHWHQFIRDGHFVSCGSLMGINAYVYDKRVEFQPPSQTFLAVHPVRKLWRAEQIFCD